jgi:hypothetical protein
VFLRLKSERRIGRPKLGYKVVNNSGPTYKKHFTRDGKTALKSIRFMKFRGCASEFVDILANAIVLGFALSCFFFKFLKDTSHNSVLLFAYVS